MNINTLLRVSGALAVGFASGALYPAAQSTLSQVMPSAIAMIVIAYIAMPLLVLIAIACWPARQHVVERVIVVYMAWPASYLLTGPPSGLWFGTVSCTVLSGLPFSAVAAYAGVALGRSVFRRHPASDVCICGDTVLWCDEGRCSNCGADAPGAEPRCLSCGYLLTGLTTDRCPECGASRQ